jgi:hypothetical protein
MAAPTDILNEDIKELRIANQRIVDRLDRLVDTIAESNKAAARLEERVDRSLSVARWAVGLLTVVIVASAPAVLGVYRDVAVMKNSIDRIESKIDRLGQPNHGKIEAPRDRATPVIASRPRAPE